MGFNIEEFSSSFGNRNLTEVYLLDEFQKAEKNGLTRIIIEKPDLMEYESMVGQIFFYEDRRLREEEEAPMKNIWKLVDGKPHTIRERRGGGHVQDEAGELIFEVVEGDYLPEKTQFLSQREVTEIADLAGKGLWKVGRYLINEDGSYGQIKSIQTVEVEDEVLTRESPKNNPHKESIMKDAVGIVIAYEKDRWIDVNKPDFDGEKTYTNEDGDFSKFESDWNVIEDTDLLGYERKVLEAKEMGSLEVFDEQIRIGTSQEEMLQQDMGEGSTALMGTKSQDQLQVIHDNMYKKRNMSSAVRCSFKRVIRLKKEELDLILENEKKKMELMKEELEYQVGVFKKQMKKIQRLITTLEIYMGESENLVQIAEGENAPDDEVIHLRQMMLYMDEEFGDPDEGGLDFKTIEKFDEWIVESGNFERLVPEQKCVVVMRPRRYDKEYEDLRGDSSIWAAMEADRRRKLNSKFYVLIRNGQNLYKIFTDNIEFGARLFPLKSELQEFMDKMAASQVEMSKHEVRDYSYKRAEEDFEDANDQLFYYQRNFLLLQGIIMRTVVFNPIPQDFNFLDVNTHEGVVKFIYDEETSLSDGRLRFRDYKAKINSSIVKGSRIVIAQGYRLSDYEDRFNFYVSDGMRYGLETPDCGLHTVKERKIKDWGYETEWMLRSKWEIINKEQEVNKAKYKVTTRHSKNSSSTSYNYPEGKLPKFERANKSRGIGKDEEVEVYVLDEKGKRIKIEVITKQLYVSYSYPHRYTKKPQHKTFIIKPTDNQIINYDALVLDDLDYYITNRMDRPNYLNMMPLLYRLRDELREEHKSEEGFAMLTKNELLREYPTLGELDIETMIWDAIEWWKNKKATVWKRPIAKDDGKALEMILQEVKKKCKKAGKKNINTGTNYKEALLVWKIRRHTFFGFGITKKEFAAQVDKLKSTSLRILNTDGFSKCINEVRGIRMPRGYREERMMEEALENKGKVQLLNYR